MKNNKRTNNNKQRIKIPQSTNVYEKKKYIKIMYIKLKIISNTT